MALNEALQEIVLNLPEWEQESINEAQVSQAIVLRILHELGYNIWNPFEVFPQETGNSGIPDYIVTVRGKRRFVLEVKKLGYAIDSRSKTQAVAYANNQAIRWAVLTNGIDWLLFDSFQVLEAHKRLLLSLSLKEHEPQPLSQHLASLLRRDLWEQNAADEVLEASARETCKHLERYRQFQPLADKLTAFMTTYTVQDPLRGLNLVTALGEEQGGWSDEDKKLIEGNESFLLELIAHPAAEPPKPAPPTSLADALIQGIALTSPSQRRAASTDVQVSINGQVVAASNWRDLHAGIAEAFLLLGQDALLEATARVYGSEEERRKRDGSPYSRHSYRRLSNGRFLFLHHSASGHAQRSRKLLQALGTNKGIIEVRYGDKTLSLP